MKSRSDIDKIGFDHKGIGTVLRSEDLAVPVNQREYSWEEEHVNDLLNDFERVINKESYFLGTIVITKGESNRPEVTDGQQRLATTTMLFAAIRDYLVSTNDKQRSQAIESKYLLSTEFISTDVVPKLRLNVDDNEFFTKHVVSHPDSTDRKIQPKLRSHERIDRAFAIAKAFVLRILAPYDKADQRIARLNEWIQFIDSSAQVIVLRVPDQLNAFKMFETLNDRGLRASQADLLKNYLLSLAEERMREAQQKWAQMIGTLETSSREDQTVTYLHHFLITKYGPMREREVFDRVKDEFQTQARALEFLEELRDAATDYVALSISDHQKWSAYGTGTKKNVHTMYSYVRVEQIKPLMFAVARHFPKDEAKKVFALFVNWSVRFLIVGGRGGVLEKAYGEAAQKVTSKEIKTAKGLYEDLKSILHVDTVFEPAFAEASVSRRYFARYLLRSLEIKKKGVPEPDFVPNEDESQITLEHIAPENPGDKWPNLSPDEAIALFRRLGNMVLLQASKNTVIGNGAFSEKKGMFADSSFLLTQEVGQLESDKWSVDEVSRRQKALAILAVQTWPNYF